MFKSEIQEKPEILEAPPSVFADVFKHKQDKLQPYLKVSPTFCGFKPDGVTFTLVVPIK